MYSCIILDDDDIDLLMVVSFVKRFPFIKIMGTFDDPTKALEFVTQNAVDIAFLDVDMPDVNGLEFRKKMMQIPACVFISAHPEFAVESFELDTLDFIAKPLKFDRFQQTIARIQDYLELKEKAQLLASTIGGDVIFIKEGHEEVKVKLHEILYLEALKDYTKIVTGVKRHYVLSNLGNLLKEKHFQAFVRVHRSYAVQKNKIQRIGTTEVILNKDISVPLGRSYKDQLSFL